MQTHTVNPSVNPKCKAIWRQCLVCSGGFYRKWLSQGAARQAACWVRRSPWLGAPPGQGRPGLWEPCL